MNNLSNQNGGKWNQVLIPSVKCNNSLPKEITSLIAHLTGDFFHTEETDPFLSLFLILTSPQSIEICSAINQNESMVHVFWKALLLKESSWAYLITRDSFASKDSLQILFNTLAIKN